MILSAKLDGDNSALARLTPQHLADLRASGLSDQQIAACRFHSLKSPALVQGVLRWKRYNGELGDCLCIPFMSAEGNPTGYARLKPDHPRKSKDDGKPIKYESPKGVANRAYFPPSTRATLKGSSIPMVLTEGEKKAAAADQHGFASIGLVGDWGWQKKRIKGKDGKSVGERELIDDLSAIPWQGRPVYLVFDSDAATNPNVRWAEWHLAEALARRGATVKVIRLPAGDPKPDRTLAKVGLDDFLLAHGPDAFRELLTSAVDPTPPEKGLTPNEAADDPHRLARLFIAERCQHADGLTLRFYREAWNRWAGSAWHVLPDEELRAELTVSAKAEMDRVNMIAQKLVDDEKPPTVRKVTGRLIAEWPTPCRA
jgi:putative DNA primase/helicase